MSMGLPLESRPTEIILSSVGYVAVHAAVWYVPVYQTCSGPELGGFVNMNWQLTVMASSARRIEAD